MYNVWLLRSEEYPLEKYLEVVELLNAFPGVLQFKTLEKEVLLKDEPLKTDFFDPDTFKRQKDEPMMFYNYSLNSNLLCHDDPEPQAVRVRKWDNIFLQCNQFRGNHDIGHDEFVVLLTEHGNEYNWFMAGDPSGKRNLFVHTAFWGYFTGTDQRFPVAYHIVSAVMKKMVFHNYADLDAHFHRKTIGCINDFCMNKHEVSLKLRTADICEACLDLFEERNLDKAVLNQVLATIEGIREQMLYKKKLKVNPHLLKLHIKSPSMEFSFPELGNLPLRLTPLEKTVYLFFLQHPEGVKLVDIPDYRDEIFGIYHRLYTGSNLEEVATRVDDLVNTFNGNSLSEKISRIKSKFKKALSHEIADHYCIMGENGGEKRILLDRKFVVPENYFSGFEKKVTAV